MKLLEKNYSGDKKIVRGFKLGTMSELLTQTYFIKNGYSISTPINHFNEYDLVVEKNGNFQRIQVKSLYWDTNKRRYVCNLETAQRKGNHKTYLKKYTENSFDFLCAAENDTNSLYLIPIKNILGRRGITFYPTGKPKNVSNRFNDFEEFRVQ